MTEVSFSIIIPNLHSPIIGKTLDYLQKQDYRGTIEFIVVGRDRFFQVYENENIKFIETDSPVNPAKARNIGIHASNGKILIFLDSDCLPSPNWLSTLEKTFENPSIDIVGGGIDFPHDNYWTLCDNIGSFYPFMKNTRSGVRDNLPSINLAIRKPILDKVGTFNERYPLPAGEDSELTTRFRLFGYKLFFNPNAWVTHLPQRNSLKEIFTHSYNYGRFSVKVDPRYRNKFSKNAFFINWWMTILLSPIFALGVIIKLIWMSGSDIRIYLALPIIYLAKIIWCFGAARTLREGSPIK